MAYVDVPPRPTSTRMPSPLSNETADDFDFDGDKLFLAKYVEADEGLEANEDEEDEALTFRT